MLLWLTCASHRTLIPIEVMSIVSTTASVVVLTREDSISTIKVVLLLLQLRGSLVLLWAPIPSTSLSITIIALGLVLSITVVVTTIATAILTVYLLLLLHEDAIQLNIAVIHDEVFTHEAFEAITINHIKSAMLPQASHQVLHTSLIRLPLFDMSLYLHLRVG